MRRNLNQSAAGVIASSKPPVVKKEKVQSNGPMSGRFSRKEGPAQKTGKAAKSTK